MPMTSTASLLLFAAAAAAAAAGPEDLEAKALEADDACAADGAGCSLSALQLQSRRGRGAAGAAPPPSAAKSMGLQRLPRSRRRRETAGHVGDGRLEGAAWSDYAVDATIGGQTFQVIVDTGSSTFAVAAAPGEGCWEYYSGPCLQKHIAAYYGSGNWTGDVCSGPEVTLAGLSAGSPLFAGIKTQDNFLTDCSRQSSGIVSEGIVGMAYQELIEGFDGVPLFDSVVSTSGIPNIFSMQCCGWKGGAAAGGQLVLGGVDSSLYTGEFQWTPITRHLWFCVELVDAYVEGHVAPPPAPEPECPATFPAVQCFYYSCGNAGATCEDGLCKCPSGTCFTVTEGFLGETWQCVPPVEEPFARLQQLGALRAGRADEALNEGSKPPGCNAIIDSGTSEIVFTSEHYRKVMHALTEVAEQVVGDAECIVESMLGSFPNVTIVLGGGVKLSVPPTTYFQPRGDGSGCYIHFIGSGSSPSIIGQPLMEAYYTVFDKANDRIGFAPIAGCD